MLKAFMRSPKKAKEVATSSVASSAAGITITRRQLSPQVRKHGLNRQSMEGIHNGGDVDDVIDDFYDDGGGSISRVREEEDTSKKSSPQA